MTGRGSVVAMRLADDGAIHVAQDEDGYWWAAGSEGSYGGSRVRRAAIACAVDASATAFQGTRRIVVHHRDHAGTVDCVITKVHTRPSSQLFQDSTP